MEINTKYELKMKNKYNLKFCLMIYTHFQYIKVFKDRIKSAETFTIYLNIKITFFIGFVATIFKASVSYDKRALFFAT